MRFSPDLPILRALVLLAVGVALAVWLSQPDAGRAQGMEDRHGHGMMNPRGGGMPHRHPPVPPEYRDVQVPAGLWTNRVTIERGRSIYAAKCAVCHGERGDGKGPGAAGLALKPPSFRDRAMMAEMSPAYSFWRVSEGGTVEPFKSMGSAMPAWKNDLSVEDRWAVIAYQHTFSGHRGPHLPSQHPELRGGGAQPRH